MSIFMAELVGTMILILLGNGVVAAVLLKHSKAEASGWIVITWGWAIAVMTGAFAAGQFSGAHLNPAVTLGFLIDGRIEGGDVVQYLGGQIVGAAIGQVLVFLAYYQHYKATDDPGLKLATHSTIPAIRNPLWNTVTEAITTFMLVFGIMAIFADEKTAADALGPLLVGLLILGLGVSLGGPTGYAINPVRDLVPRIMHQILPIPGKGDSDWSYAWVPVVGPLIGGAVAALVYMAVFPG